LKEKENENSDSFQIQAILNEQSVFFSYFSFVKFTEKIMKKRENIAEMLLFKENVMIQKEFNKLRQFLLEIEQISEELDYLKVEIN